MSKTKSSSHRAPSYQRRLAKRAAERTESERVQGELAASHAAEDAAKAAA